MSNQFLISFLALLLFNATALLADLKSNNGTINFDIHNNGNKQMVLNSNGLGIGVSSPSSNLDFRGSMSYGVSMVTSNANLLNLNSMVIVTSSTNNVELTLPAPSAVNGRVYTIKHSSNDIHSTLTSSANIDGQPYFSLRPIPNSFINPFVTVLSDGSTWNVINYKNQTLADTVASSNLVVWWTFDDVSNGIFNDSGSYGNDGVISGSSNYQHITGRIGAAVKSLARVPLLSLTHNTSTTLNSLSAGFWIKASDAAVATWQIWRGILRKTDFAIGWQVDVNGSATRKIRTRTDSSSSSSNKTTAETDVFDDTWHHVVYTAGAGSINFYVDGNSISNTSYDTGAGNTISNNINITLDMDVEMSIDEVRIYDRVLTSGEVAQWFSE